MSASARVASPVLRAGLWALDVGWALVLTAPGTKRPHWRTPTVYDVITDTGLLEGLLLESPEAGLAVNLGASRLASIEDDGPGGLERLAELERRAGALPVTWGIQARRGRHRLFRVTKEVRGRRLGPELELKSRGQMILLPPTTADGVTRRWIVATLTRPLALLPDWVAGPPRAWEPAPVVVSTTGAARAAVNEVQRRLAARPTAPNTGRGTALFAASCELGRHIAAGTLTVDEAMNVLRAAGVRLCLDAYQRERSIRRGIAIGSGRWTR